MSNSQALLPSHDFAQRTESAAEPAYNPNHVPALLVEPAPSPVAGPLTVSRLIDAYKNDVDSPFHKLRWHTRGHYRDLCRRLERDLGAIPLGKLKARELLHWHAGIEATGHIAMAHSVVGQLRILVNFGATILENRDCIDVATVLSKMRFKMSKPRVERLTAEQAILIRGEAHRINRRSIAVAQAFQCDLMLRQKDVIGEWVPEEEPGESETFDLDMKWLRGLRWENINADFILTHITSKRQKKIVRDLKLAPMISQELILWFGALDRKRMPDSGPVVISEASYLPWRAVEFRRNWRACANAVGISRNVRSMDTRAGSISRALEAGALPEQVRKMATHSNFSTTQNYSRGEDEAAVQVMQIVAASRKAS